MKKLTYTLTLLIIIISCKSKEDYNIFCEIDGLNNQTALIAFIPESDRDIEIIDTVQFIDGKLKYNFNASELHTAMIIPYDLFHKFENGKTYPTDASRITFYIDSLDQINITASIENSIIDFETLGNSFSEHESRLRKYLIPILKKDLQLLHEQNSSNPKERDYYSLRYQLNVDRWNKQIDYVEDHLNLKYSAKLLYGANLEERVNKTYEKLSPEVKSSYYGQILKYRIDSKNVKTIGAKFPNINDTTLNDSNWVLSDFKGKYVLIDFWGSWCVPCIAEIPTLKKLENDFKNELEIIGIACNDNESRLRELINKKEITWNNILEGKSDQNNYSVRFGIQGFPTKILLNPNAEVLKIYSGLEENLYSEIKEIIK